MKNVGIITFHASHNFGSMLQAYATQKLFSNYYSVEIINYRMPSQLEYYKLYQTEYGAMRFFRDLLLLPIHSKRKKSFTRYEAFMNKYMNLSGDMINNPDELKNKCSKYDLLVSGGDQIWSNRVPEIKKAGDKYSDAYFLFFGNDNQVRISFATSTGESTKDELSKKVLYLKKYNAISVREDSGAERLSDIVEHKVDVLLDPTLLVDTSLWSNMAGDKPIINEPYIFLYTLRGARPGIKWGKALNNYASKNGLKVICISPFFPILNNNVVNISDAGPLEFLNYIKYANVVFTDSFHGTAFSIAFMKEFYSMTGHNSNDDRKRGLLRKLGLEDRAISSFDEIYNLNYSTKTDYSNANNVIASYRNKATNYIRKYAK